ncbi:MAG TPA: glycerate-2-kinase family protein, partial [Vulgatibacter sp.]
MPISLRDELVEIYEASVSAVAGDRLVRDHLESRRDTLPKDPRSVVAIALGKAAGAMAMGASQALGPIGGIAVGTPGIEAPTSFETIAGDHPVPGPRSIRAGIRLLAFVRSIRPDQTALVLLSGGGSALAEALPSSLSLVDLAETNRLLLGAGAPIEEITVLRKHLSRVKGGRLAAACAAERGELLAISDVDGDDLGVIASGPFSPDPSTFADARQIVAARGLAKELPAQVMGHLRSSRDESPKPGNPIFDRWTSAVLAGPARLAASARKEGERRGFRVVASTG